MTDSGLSRGWEALSPEELCLPTQEVMTRPPCEATFLGTPFLSTRRQGPGAHGVPPAVPGVNALAKVASGQGATAVSSAPLLSVAR